MDKNSKKHQIKFSVIDFKNVLLAETFFKELIKPENFVKNDNEAITVIYKILDTFLLTDTDIDEIENRYFFWLDGIDSSFLPSCIFTGTKKRIHYLQIDSSDNCDCVII